MEPNKDGQQAATAEGTQGAGTAEQAGAETAKVTPPQFITPEILTGVLARKDRSDQENLKKQLEAFGSTFEQKLAQKLEEALAKATPSTKAEGGKAGPGDNAAAILALEKDLKEAKARIEAESKARQDAEQSARDYKFQTKVEAALARNKCTNTGVAFLAIKPHLAFDTQTDKITAKVKDTQFNLGEVEVDLDTFIKTQFAEEILPELFLGKVRPGAPAGGDSGAGGPGSKGVYKESDIAKMTPQEYVANRDKIEEARKLGRIQQDVGRLAGV